MAVMSVDPVASELTRLAALGIRAVLLLQKH